MNHERHALQVDALRPDANDLPDRQRDLISSVSNRATPPRKHEERGSAKIEERAKSDRLAAKVDALLAEGRSSRWICRDLP